MADIASEAPTVELGNQWVRTADRMPDIPGDEKSWAHVSVIAAKKGSKKSDLKIYDKPKSLSGFSRHDFRGMNETDVCGNESCEHYQPSGSYMLPPTCAINGCCLSKPPQSWCYVAETEEDDAL